MEGLGLTSAVLKEYEGGGSNSMLMREPYPGYEQEESPLRKKSFYWALNTSKLLRSHYVDTFERQFAHQVVRSSTATAAAVEEANAAASKKQFICKIRHALQEANESKLWLSPVSGLHFADDAVVRQILADGQEVRYILAAIIKTFTTRHPDL